MRFFFVPGHILGMFCRVERDCCHFIGMYSKDLCKSVSMHQSSDFGRLFFFFSMELFLSEMEVKRLHSYIPSPFRLEIVDAIPRILRPHGEHTPLKFMSNGHYICMFGIYARCIGTLR